MARILIINGHQPYPLAEGRLNAALVERAKAFFEDRGDEVRVGLQRAYAPPPKDPGASPGARQGLKGEDVVDRRGVREQHDQAVEP